MIGQFKYQISKELLSHKISKAQRNTKNALFVKLGEFLS